MIYVIVKFVPMINIWQLVLLQLNIGKSDS